MSHLTVSGLWKGYGEQPVLRDLKLDVRAGSLTAVLGLSGCGKTTLLRVIAGFERAERGVVTLGGMTLDDGGTYIPPERRSIGYVPQEGALFPHLTVAGNVGFGLRRRERAGRTVTDLLDLVGIAPLAKRMPHELSGGEQQRTALARALALQPQALLLDEPFSSLDASLRIQVREEVHALLSEQGVTVVLVTHDQEEALSLADSVAVLRDGQIVQHGSPAELYGHPADESLARFLGAVNVIGAEFDGATARTRLGSLSLHAQAVVGDERAVMVRPEQLEVQLLSETDGERATGLVGQVEQCRYYGHDALLHIGAEGLEEPLLARVHGTDALPIGARVAVSARGQVTPVSRTGEHAIPTVRTPT